MILAVVNGGLILVLGQEVLKKRRDQLVFAIVMVVNHGTRHLELLADIPHPEIRVAVFA